MDRRLLVFVNPVHARHVREENDCHKLFLKYISKHVGSKSRTYHGQVGSGPTAGRRGRVGQDWTPTKQFAQETSVPRTLQASKTRRSNVSPEARTSEILCNLSNPKPGHTTGGSGRGARRTAEQGVGLGANRIDRPGDKGPSYLPGHRRHVA